MTNNIRTAVKETMREEGITQTDIAAQFGVPRTSITRLLSGTSGAVPSLWARLLDELGLELTVAKK